MFSPETSILGNIKPLGFFSKLFKTAYSKDDIESICFKVDNDRQVLINQLNEIQKAHNENTLALSTHNDTINSVKLLLNIENISNSNDILIHVENIKSSVDEKNTKIKDLNANISKLVKEIESLKNKLAASNTAVKESELALANTKKMLNEKHTNSENFIKKESANAIMKISNKYEKTIAVLNNTIEKLLNKNTDNTSIKTETKTTSGEKRYTKNSLSCEDIKKIKELKEQGKTLSTISGLYKISKSATQRILSGETYKQCQN